MIVFDKAYDKEEQNIKTYQTINFSIRIFWPSIPSITPKSPSIRWCYPHVSACPGRHFCWQASPLYCTPIWLGGTGPPTCRLDMRLGSHVRFWTDIVCTQSRSRYHPAWRLSIWRSRRRCSLCSRGWVEFLLAWRMRRTSRRWSKVRGIWTSEPWLTSPGRPWYRWLVLVLPIDWISCGLLFAWL